MTFKLQKYFYAFGVCVGIPCLALGYMAFRGIRNDQAVAALRSGRSCDHKPIVPAR